MSEKNIAKKAEIVEKVVEKFNNASSAIIVDYRGLTVSEVTELRKQLREADCSMHVIKNGILSRAVSKASLDDLKGLFVGPSAVAFSNNDAVAPARILSNFSKEATNLKIKGGVIEGKIVDVAEITSLAKLPNREGMLSMLLSVLQAPMRNLAYGIKAVAEAKEGEAA